MIKTVLVQKLILEKKIVFSSYFFLELSSYTEQILYNFFLRNKVSPFDTLEEYRAFVRGIIIGRNKRVEKAFTEERAFLKSLPERKTCDYTEERVRVTSSSTIAIKKVTYSVPSRLIGMIIKVHLYDDRLECYIGGDHIATVQRLRKHKKCHFIDYRHVVGILLKKPQAFRNYIYQDQMFPTFAFRQTWECLNKTLDARKAC